jgi:prevent-host-death family protein
MTRVGIRELRQRASELLRRVENGESFEVTDRGRPVAMLAPLPEQSPLDRLRTAGDVTPAQRDLNDLPDPMALAPGQEQPSSVLDRLRRDER